MADGAHLTSRSADGQDDCAEAIRTALGENRQQLVAAVYVDALVRGGDGAARGWLHIVESDLGPEVDPWELIEAVAITALRTGFGGSPFDG